MEEQEKQRDDNRVETRTGTSVDEGRKTVWLC
jgi:hypothetical protein